MQNFFTPVHSVQLLTRQEFGDFVTTGRPSL